MDLSKLRYAIEVDRQGSISKAAQMLYMGQPNLSKMIKELEEELNITLFTRTPKGVCSTPEGAQFLIYARSILSQVDELESLYKKEFAHSTEFRLCVPRATYISSTFGAFIEQSSFEGQIHIQYKETNSINILHDVTSDLSDLGIIRYQSISEDYFLAQFKKHHLDYKTLYTFKQQLLMSKNHPLASYDVVPYHMLTGYTELVHGDFQIPGIDFSNIKKEASLSQPYKRIYVYDRGSQYDLLERVTGSFMWVSPFSQAILDDHNFVLRPCDLADLVHKDVFIYKQNKSLPSPLKAFMDFCYTSNKSLF